MRNFIIFLFMFSLLFSACKSSENSSQSSKDISNPEQSIADNILAQSIKAHGGEKYNTAHYSFTFRKKQYTFENNNDQYEYKVISTKNGIRAENTLNNVGLTRTVNGKMESLDEKKITGYSGGLNSVIYFATLPYKLQDPAVNTKYIGETTIKEKNYHVLEITFDKVGGGKDHDDEFYYWINQDDFRIDYLAYNYAVNKGGVRFRSAYNTRIVDGILFQDYVNYKAEVGTPLAGLPKLYEQDALKKLSLIETEDVKSLK